MPKLSAAARDHLRRPVGALIGWGIPILAVISVNFAREALAPDATVLVLSGAFAWMGAACIANALRCGRLHCYVSGPVFLIGATLIVLAGFRLAPLGPISVGHISFATIGLALASFALEWVWGAYASRSRRG